MSELPPAKTASRAQQDESFRLVGRFLFHFAELEQEIDRGIGTILGLSAGAREIAAANMDFARKVNVLRSAEAFLGKKPDKDRQKLLSSTYDAVFKFNDKRNIVAHCTFAPAVPDGVTFRRAVAKKRLSVTNPVWTAADFEQAFAQMEEVRGRVAKIVDEMEHYAASFDFNDPRNSGLLALFF